MKKLIQMWRTAAPDIDVEIISQQAEGDKVATRFICSGTQTGPLLGIPPTGRTARWPGSRSRASTRRAR